MAEPQLALHFHDTRGMGMANVVAGLDMGLTTYDSSLGGLGGCPYAPGATGNIVYQDAVLVMRELEGLSYEEMAQTMGCSKGTIMSRLFHARKNMQKRLIDLIENPSKELLDELGMKDADDDAAASGAR